nr:hypothetical protein [Tanacetum cinerariifolium]
MERFQIEYLNKHSNQFNDNGTKKDNVGGRKNGDGAKGTANSYAHAVKGTQGQKEVMDDIPSLVLDDSCLNQKVYSLCLLGKIIQLHNDFTIDERVTWVEIEGVPCKWWSRNTFSRIASRWSTLLNGDELEDEGFHRKRICICMNMKTNGCLILRMRLKRGYDSYDGSHEDEVKGGDFGDLKDLEGNSDVEEVPKSKFKEESNKHTLEENSVTQSNAQSEDPFGIYEVKENQEKDKIGSKPDKNGKQYDSFNSQNFSRDDDLPSPNNEDKVFNPGIIIHEKSVKIITRVAQEKKLAISYASLVCKDFDPPFYEPIIFKEVPNSMRLLPFLSENEEKVFKPGIYTSEKPGHLAARLGCAETKFATWDDLAFKLMPFGWNVKH